MWFVRVFVRRNTVGPQHDSQELVSCIDVWLREKVPSSRKTARARPFMPSEQEEHCRLREHRRRSGAAGGGAVTASFSGW